MGAALEVGEQDAGALRRVQPPEAVIEQTGFRRKQYLLVRVGHLPAGLVIDVLGQCVVDRHFDHESGGQVPDPYQQVLLSSEAGLLYDCLGRLDASKRSSILLAYLEGCTHSEIADRLATPLGTIKAWIRRGLQALKECLA